MSEVVYSRTKRNVDRVTRCYLTLDCNGFCEYCSAGVPGASQEVREQSIAPEVWAEGINRRGRECILAGGEPFMYPWLTELTNMIRVRTQIYTNLKCDVSGFLSAVKRPLAVLASCHIMDSIERQAWLENARGMINAGHHLRFHIVKSEGWRERVTFIRDNGIQNQITACDDQRGGIKSSGQKTNDLMPSVTCRHKIFLFGPDGYRYHCITLMRNGDKAARLERISDGDRPDETIFNQCDLFGLCVGCDNNIQGEVLSNNRGNG